VEKGDPALTRILDRIKDMEARGYSYDTAQASFELLARDELGLSPAFFEVKRYRVTVERRRNKRNEMVSLSEDRQRRCAGAALVHCGGVREHCRRVI